MSKSTALLEIISGGGLSPADQVEISDLEGRIKILDRKLRKADTAEQRTKIKDQISKAREMMKEIEDKGSDKVSQAKDVEREVKNKLARGVRRTRG